MRGSRQSFYVHARCFALLAVLAFPAVQAADQPPLPDIPDPFGLGPRLALIDHLRTEFKDEPPADATYEQLVARYWLRVDGGASAAEAYRLRMALRDFGQPAPEGADLATLRQLHATEKAKAQERAREEAQARNARAPTQVVVVMRDREPEPEVVDDRLPAAPAPALAESRAADAAAQPQSTSGMLWLVAGGAAFVALVLLLVRRGAGAPAAAPVAAAEPSTTRRLRANGIEAGIGGRMRQAIADLLLLLPSAADGRIQDREFSALLAWRSANREALAHPALRRFSSWFNGIISDGALDPAERAELADFCTRFTANEIVAVPPGRDGGVWRHQPASGHQLAYLRALDLTPQQTEGLTRGQACDLIDRLHEERAASGAAFA